MSSFAGGSCTPLLGICPIAKMAIILALDDAAAIKIYALNGHWAWIISFAFFSGSRWQPDGIKQYSAGEQRANHGPECTHRGTWQRYADWPPVHLQAHGKSWRARMARLSLSCIRQVAGRKLQQLAQGLRLLRTARGSEPFIARCGSRLLIALNAAIQFVVCIRQACGGHFRD